jgi:putative transposase
MNSVRSLCHLVWDCKYHIVRTFRGRTRNFTDQNFGARDCFVSTVGRDEKVIRNYIRRQENSDYRVDQLKLLS